MIWTAAEEVGWDLSKGEGADGSIWHLVIASSEMHLDCENMKLATAEVVWNILKKRWHGLK